MHTAQEQAEQVSSAKNTPSGELCDVESVYDGDTAWVVCNGQREKLRLYCIDAPEMQQKPWGTQSRDHLRSIIGDTVSVERVEMDRYGRTVARIWSGDLDLNGQMLRDGWAVVYPKYCPKSESVYRRLEVSAQNRDDGIWVNNGEQTKPWVWRANK